MGVPEEHIDRVVAAIARDLSATLGWSAGTATSFVREHGSVEDYADHASDALTLAANVIENVQEAVHRELIDTQWPLCLHHGRHPLTIDSDLVWRCYEEDLDDPAGFPRRVPLGWLDTVWPSA